MSDVPGAASSSVQVWDLPLRVFHWLLVLAILAAYLTGEFGGSAWIVWHGRIGAAVLGLLIFRILWGFVGNEHARFRNFLPTPRRVIDYVQGRWQGHGHNPLGALSVIAMLLLIGAQVTTGLFANDDITFTGPLAASVAKSTSDSLTAWHQLIFNWLAGAIGLHVAAIAAYYWLRGVNLVGPMVTGRKAVAVPAVVPPLAWWRFALAAGLSLFIVVGVFRGAPAGHAEAAAAPVAAPDW